jgi:hypothetical protein
MDNATCATKRKGKLSLVAGVSPIRELDRETAGRFAGQTVETALSRIIEEEVRDPQLRALLDEPRLALELSANDGSGELLETPLSPTDSWQRVLDVLESADAELGIARTHEGGKAPCV